MKMSDVSRPARARKAALAAFPERFGLPGRPSNAPAVVQDAHRQTGFLLSNELHAFERGMNLQLRIVAANAKLRTHEAAALFGFWSRTYSGLADACALMSAGAYASCAPVLRTALDCLAAQRSLIRDAFQEYEDWFLDAVCQAPEQQALAFDLGRFRAGGVLAENERLGMLYRLLSDLSMPHFGSTALQVAPDSGLQRLALTFGDQAFHLGWAEIIAGWLLTLSLEQLETAAGSGIFRLDGDIETDLGIVRRETAACLGNRRRCRVEEAGGRFLFHNFRRSPSGAYKRVML
jgi:hypothetical protein